MNVLCLDVEASGLGPGSFPLEIALAPVSLGEPVSWLIRPTAVWLASGVWSDDAEALHGLSVASLQAEGISPHSIADELTALLWGSLVLSDNAQHDMTWLRMLYQAAGATNPPCEVKPYTVFLASLEASAADIEGAETGARTAYPIQHRAGPDAARLAYVLRALSQQSTT